MLDANALLGLLGDFYIELPVCYLVHDQRLLPQVILNVIGRGMNLLSAVVAPRVHSQLLPDQVNVECKTAEDLAWLPPPVDSSSSSRDGQAGRSIEMEEGVYDLLRKTRHRNVSGTASSVGITQFIAVDPDSGSLTAVSDPRKNGIPAGMV